MEKENGKKEEKKGKTGIYINYRKDGTAYGVMVVGDFPIAKCQEWEAECKREFNGIRWVKIVNDHEKAKAFDMLVQQKFDVQLDQKTQTEEKEEESPLLSGDKLK